MIGSSNYGQVLKGALECLMHGIVKYYYDADTMIEGEGFITNINLL